MRRPLIALSLILLRLTLAFFLSRYHWLCQSWVSCRFIIPDILDVLLSVQLSLLIRTSFIFALLHNMLKCLLELRPVLCRVVSSYFFVFEYRLDILLALFGLQQLAKVTCLPCLVDS